MKNTIQTQLGISTTFAHANSEIARLIRSLTKQNLALVDISVAQAALESLPIAADEFSQAVNRLRTAHRYELQLLAASLKSLRQRYV